jgi:hypothetical protein
VNRVVVSSIISIFIIALMAVGYYYFSVYKEKFSNPEEALPASAALIIKGNLKNVYTELENQGIWSQLDSLSLMGDIRKEFEVLLQNTSDKSEIADLLESEQTLVSLHVTGADKADLLFLMPSPKDVSISTMRKTLLGERPDEYRQRSFSGKDIYEVSFPHGWQFTFSISNGVFIGSFTSGLVEDAIRQQETGKAFWGNKKLDALFNSVSVSSSYCIALNYAQLSGLFAVSLNPDSNDKLNELTEWAGWSVHALSFAANQITAKGYILAADTMQIISGFNNCHGAVSDVIKVLSQNTVAYQTHSFSDACPWIDESKKRIVANDFIKAVERNIAKTEKEINFPVRRKFKDVIDKEVTLALSGNPSGSLDNNTLAFIRVKNVKAALQTLSGMDKALSKSNSPAAVEQFKNHEIRLLNIEGLLPALFGSSFSVIRKNYYTIQDNFLVFANKPSLLRKYIEDVEGGLLLSRLPESLQNEIKKTSDNMFTLLIRPEQCTPVWQAIASAPTQQMLARSNYLERINTFYYAVSNISNAEGNCNFFINTQSGGMKQAASRMWAYFADNALQNGPYIFARDNEKFILYQDDSASLHCIDQNGNNRWSLQVDSLIAGRICLAPNDNEGKLQFAFATTSQVYVVNETGNIATRYPMKLPVSAKYGLASSPSTDVYFVACDNEMIYAFEYGGRPAKKWNNVKWSGNDWQCSFSPNGKSVVFMDNQNLMYYTIDGASRFLKSATDFNLQNYRWSNDSVPQFVCQDKEGSLVRINMDGSFTKQAGAASWQWIGQLAEGGNTVNYIISDNKLLKITSDKKILSSADLKGQVTKSTLVAGDKGVYCVMIIDKMLNIFDQHLKAVSGFPVATTGYDILKQDNKVYLITLSGQDRLAFYEL